MAGNATISVALIVVLALLAESEAFIGMNWGRQSAQRLVPSQVVDLLMQNRIGNARIFSSEEDQLKAFAGSGINLTVTIYDLQFGVFGNANGWFKAKSKALLGANVRTVVIGSDPYIFNPSPNMTHIDKALSALRSLQRVLDESGNGHIQTNTLHASISLTVVTKPSECEFIPQVKEKMMEFIDFLRIKNAPFLIDMKPILDARRANLSLSFALAGNDSVPINDVGGAVYTNVFEWQYDCFAWALKKLNASDIKIVISQVGWPTDGLDGANVVNAQRFFKYLLPLVTSNKGTPVRPGAPIDVFVQGLTDEPKMKSVNSIDRHWGIYRSNGQPKYMIDLSGRGGDVYPTVVKGIMRMPRRWCVFNGNTHNMDKVVQQVARACTQGDCTTLAPGASCSRLDFNKNVSYAFNVYFQTHFQDETVCNFKGLGRVSEEDPSTEECVFPVEVVKGQQKLDKKLVPSGAPRFTVDPILLIVINLFIFWDSFSRFLGHH